MRYFKTGYVVKNKYDTTSEREHTISRASN